VQTQTRTITQQVREVLRSWSVCVESVSVSLAL
jgi:hypothetical protein